MPTKNKTTQTEANVIDFINSFSITDQRKQDSIQLVDLMRTWSGFEPKMWGPTMIGYGHYHYKYASGHQGEIFIIGFSPRKAALTLYVSAPSDDNEQLLAQLGKFKKSKACIYVNKLSDINLDILEQLCYSSIRYVERNQNKH
jgi:hypothetical protein